MFPIYTISLLLWLGAFAAGIPNSNRSEWSPEDKKLYYPQSVAQWPCIHPVPTAASNLDVSWYNAPRVWYVPMGTKYAFYLYANILLGRPAKSRAELERMCLTSPSAGAVNDVIGFGARLTQEVISGPGDYTQSFIKPTGSAGTLPDALSVENDVVVLTDSSTYVLVVRCINALYKDWIVYSTKPTLPSSVKKLIREAVQGLGCDEDNLIEDLPCSCQSHHHDH